MSKIIFSWKSLFQSLSHNSEASDQVWFKLSRIICLWVDLKHRTVQLQRGKFLLKRHEPPKHENMQDTWGKKKKSLDYLPPTLHTVEIKHLNAHKMFRKLWWTKHFVTAFHAMKSKMLACFKFMLHINLNIMKWNIKFKLFPCSIQTVIPNRGKVSSGWRELKRKYQ